MCPPKARRRPSAGGMAGIVLLLLLIGSLNSNALDFRSLFRRSDVEQKIQSWLDEGRRLRQRRLIEQALDRFNEVLDIDGLHDEAIWEMAETYYQAQRWSEAVDWFYVAATFNPQKREAFPKRWSATMNLAGDDTLLQRAARQAIRRGLAEFLKDFPWDWETLSAARQGALLCQDSLLTVEFTMRLLQRFPDTPAGYDLISEVFYDGLYPIWNDTSQRADYLRAFLRDHPVSQFRETAWLYLTFAFNEKGDLADLRAAFSEWMSEDSQNPLPYERYVRYLLDKGSSPDSLLPVARRAIDLCRGWRGQPLKHAEQRVMEGKSLYAATRLNMARVLIALDRLTEARLWLQDGIHHSNFGPDDEGTTAALRYLLGLVAEHEGRFEDSFDAYIQALIEGEVRPEWIKRADSAATRLFQERFSTLAPDRFKLARQRVSYAGPIFTDITKECGLNGVSAGRVAWGDANGDGWDDLLLGGWQLFLNLRAERFLNVTDSCGLRGEGVAGGVWADADADGDLDLFCAASGQGDAADRLYLNEGNLQRVSYGLTMGFPKFREAKELASSIADTFPSEGAAWGDFQGDGRPDLYVANYEAPGAELAQGTPDYLYLNYADTTLKCGFRLERLGPENGLRPPFGKNLCGRGVNWGDFDGDGDQDIYVSNYRLQENFLWENRAGVALLDRACFYDIAGKETDGWWGHTIGSEWGDFDNDGDLDLIAANLAHPRYIEFSNRTCLYENRLRQDGLFREVRADWGIKYQETDSDPAWGDVDNDGDLDLYVTCIYPDRPSHLYLNDLAQKRFRDVTFLAGARVSNAWGCAYSDFDRDGDLDLAVGSSDGVRLFRNDSPFRHWLEILVNAPGSAYGTKAILRNGKNTQMRELAGGKGTTSQHSHNLHFGLGDWKGLSTVEIYLPSDQKLKFKDVPPDQQLKVPAH